MERHSPSYGTWDVTEVCESYDPSRGDGIKGIGTLFTIAGKFGFKQSDHREKKTYSAKPMTNTGARTTIAAEPDELNDELSELPIYQG